MSVACVDTSVLVAIAFAEAELRAVKNRGRGQLSRFHAAARAANTLRSAAHSP